MRVVGVPEKSGVELDRKRVEYIPADSIIKPLGDRIFVRPLPGLTSSLVHVVHHGKALRGTVVAVGPGYREKRRYKNSRGEVYKSGETGRVTPTEVKVGDVVELGGKEIGGYQFPRVNIGNVEHIICQERDVTMIVYPEHVDAPETAVNF